MVDWLPEHEFDARVGAEEEGISESRDAIRQDKGAACRMAVIINGRVVGAFSFCFSKNVAPGIQQFRTCFVKYTFLRKSKSRSDPLP